MIQRHGKNVIIGSSLLLGCKGSYALDAQVKYDKRTIRVTIVHSKIHWSGAKLCHRRQPDVGIEMVETMSGRHVEWMDLNVSARSENGETCLQTKQTQPSDIRRLAQLEQNHVEHSDVVGSIQLQTAGSSNYIVTFIVKRSRFAKVYTIKQRSELREISPESLDWLKGKTSITGKQLPSDQAKECVSLSKYSDKSEFANHIICTLSGNKWCCRSIQSCLLTKRRSHVTLIRAKPKVLG